MSTLHLRIPEAGLTEESLLNWVITGKDGASERSGRALLGDIAKADHIEVVLPASAVLLTSVQVPPARGAKLRQLLPFAVEDQILQDPEDVHVAAGTRQTDGAMPVAVVEKAWLHAVLNTLKQSGLAPQRVSVETLLPSFEPGSWILVWNGGDSFVRTGAFSGFALNASHPSIPPLELVQALKSARERQQAPQPIVLRPALGADTARMPNIDAWSQALGIPVVLDREWDFAQTPANTSGIDFLQGEFAATLGIKELLPRLKPALVLACLIALLQVGAWGFDWWRLSREKVALEQDMLQSVRSVFPDAKLESDTVQAVLKSRLDALRGAAGDITNSDFLALLQHLAPLARGTQSQVKTLSYQGGELRADLILPSEANAEALRNQTMPKGVQMSVEAVNRGASGSEARVVLRASRT